VPALFLHSFFDALVLTHALLHRMTAPDSDWVYHRRSSECDEIDEIRHGWLRVLLILRFTLERLEEVIERMAIGVMTIKLVIIKWRG
jgi:hypothetical protein